MTEYKGITYTPEHIASMVEWLCDCQWADMDEEDIKELPSSSILRAVDRHCCGGIQGFDLGDTIINASNVQL